MLAAILSNSLVSLIVYAGGFFLKAYLTHKVASDELVKYYVISDFFSLVMRAIVGYKDCYLKLKINYCSQSVDTFFFQFKVVFLIATSLLYFLLMYFVGAINSNVEFISIFVFQSILIYSYFVAIVVVEREYRLFNYSEFIKFITYTASVLFLVNLDIDSGDTKILLLSLMLSNYAAVAYLYFNSKKISNLNYLSMARNRFLFTTLGFDFLKQLIYSSFPHFVNGVLLFLPIFLLIKFGDELELANYQVVARSVYFALLSVFIYPIGRILLPELSSIVRYKNKLKLVRVKLITVSFLSFILGYPVFCKLSPIVIDTFFEGSYFSSFEIINILFLSLPLQLYLSFPMSIIKLLGSFHTVTMGYVIGIVVMLMLSLLLYSINVEYWVHYSFVISFSVILVYFEVKSNKLIRELH